MVKVPIQVQQGASVFNVSVQAQSIRRAVGIAAARHPGADARVLFPTDPEAFFVEDSAAEGLIEAHERTKWRAA